MRASHRFRWRDSAVNSADGMAAPDDGPTEAVPASRLKGRSPTRTIMLPVESRKAALILIPTLPRYLLAATIWPSLICMSKDNSS